MHRLLDREDLECLNFFPEGTVLHEKDRILLAGLLELCNEHGYGRVPQFAKWIEEIWREPEEKTLEFEKLKQGYREFMKENYEINL